MKTQQHTHRRDEGLDWVADPPLPPPSKRSPMWWGVTPRVVGIAAAAAVGIGLVGVLLWFLLPRPAPVPVPDNFFSENLQAQGDDDGANPAPAVDTTAFVHVTGEVANPGLVEIPADARTAEAIERAGGPTAEADLAAINLAAPVEDGEQIYLPALGEEPRPRVEEEAAEPGLVNINTATEAELQELSGIGPVLAARIIAHREANGPFGTTGDLQAVTGIGPSLMAALQSEITV